MVMKWSNVQDTDQDHDKEQRALVSEELQDKSQVVGRKNIEETREETILGAKERISPKKDMVTLERDLNEAYHVDNTDQDDNEKQDHFAMVEEEQRPFVSEELQDEPDKHEQDMIQGDDNQDTCWDIGHDNIEVAGERTTIRTEKGISTNQSTEKTMLAIERKLRVVFSILQEDGDKE